MYKATQSPQEQGKVNLKQMNRPSFYHAWNKRKVKPQNCINDRIPQNDKRPYHIKASTHSDEIFEIRRFDFFLWAPWSSPKC
jgi:hypothetical protein